MGETVQNAYSPTWCSGCGNFGIWNALKKALSTQDLDTIAFVTGIGCSSKISQYVNTYRIETLHGRALPVATGLKLANHTLKVVVAGGDGDGTGLGMGHFIHTARRNMDVAYFIHNNQIYGLTKGQTSPTSELGTVTKFSPAPLGNVERPINIVQLALQAGATFVARAYAGNINDLTDLMVQAIEHPGFAIIDILQPCVSFNKVNTYQWYQERITPLTKSPDYDPANHAQALQAAQLWGSSIPVGLFYREIRPAFHDSLPQLSEHPLTSHSLASIDILPLMKELQ